jgi:hypothetical protein
MDTSVHGSLDSAERALRRWRTLERVQVGAGLLLLAVWLATLLDLGVATPRPLRIAIWLLLAGGALGAATAAARAWRRRLNDAAAAACLERHYPNLDNRLINFVQFSGVEGGDRDAFVRAYLSRPPPALSGEMIAGLKDRRAARRAMATFAAGVLALVASGAWWGQAWTNAMARVLNPFAERAASTLDSILAIAPGDRELVAGSSLVLSCTARGRAGQPVLVEIAPEDDRRSLLEVGRFNGGTAEEFTHTLPAVASDVSYRFRAGDAVSRPFRVHVLPKLAIEELAVDVRPPPYTGLPATTDDGLRGLIRIPEGSDLALHIKANRGLVEAEISVGTQTTACVRGGDDRHWRGEAAFPGNRPLAIRVRDHLEGDVLVPIQTETLADRLPAIAIVAPDRAVTLGPGAVPAIHWDVSDDYGLSEVWLEQLDGDASTGAVVATWSVQTGRHASALWKGAGMRPPAGGEWAFQVVARDRPDRPDGRVARTPSVLFRLPAAEEKAASQDPAVVARSTLDRLISAQKRNLDTTVELGRDAGAADEAWRRVRTVQSGILDLAAELLGDPRRPLGGMAPLMQSLHERAMPAAVAALDVVVRAPAAARGDPARRAAEIEREILDRLTQMNSNVDRVAAHRRATDLLALLEALVSGQSETLGATRELPASAGVPPQVLVKRQDDLAADVSDFVRACRAEAERIRAGDETFANRVRDAADRCERERVQAEMFTAAERLDQGKPAEAVPAQERALATLTAIRSSLSGWQAAQATEAAELLHETLAENRARMEKLEKLQAAIVDAIRQTLQQKDRSGEATEELLEELQDIKANMSEALLKIAKDLQVFPELPVGNELVTDVDQIYEEVKQTAGSGETPAEELGLQKEDWILDALAAATERMEEMEMWLMPEPDALQRNMESFDQQELPDIPVIPLASEINDIIGDLLEQQEDAAKESDDSATNQGSADMPPGWAIAEGEFVNYSAQGKSGNERPDHKEQDGRSLVGRQGMSDGETVAGSGKINEGDENIEARRTQDSAQSGEVQEEGHAEAKATGGGKLSGYSDRFGMSGTGPRRDANTAASSDLGLQAQLRREAEQLYAKASLAHVRIGSMNDVVRFMRQAEASIAEGRPQREIAEHRRLAVQALKRTRAEIEGGAWSMPIGDGGVRPALPEGAVAGGVDAAPAEYRALVAEYFKALSEEPAP